MPTKKHFWNWFQPNSPEIPRRESANRDASHSTPNMVHAGNLVTRSHPLSEAVAEFNERAAADEIGRSQPLLTADEVATAIRSAGRHQLPLVESHRRLIHSVAETQLMPPNSGLKFTTTWYAPSGYRCEVWWVDLILCPPDPLPEDGIMAACSLRIRDHRLRSWRDTSVTVPRDIQRLQADHRWFSPPPTDAGAPYPNASDELLDRMLHT